MISAKFANVLKPVTAFRASTARVALVGALLSTSLAFAQTVVAPAPSPAAPLTAPAAPAPQSVAPKSTTAATVSSPVPEGVAPLPALPQASKEIVDGKANQLNWLAGCWKATSQTGDALTEVWLKPIGGVVLGLGNTEKGGVSRESEAMRIFEEGTTLKLSMKPARRAEMLFALENISPNSVMFAMVDKDVTTFVGYAVKPIKEGQMLTVSVRNQKDKTRRGVDYEFLRAECDAFLQIK
jgi:hypothetical protein